MRTTFLPYVLLPANLSDDAAAQLLACLRDITRVLEQHYADVLDPEPHCVDGRQQSLWPEHEPPF